MRLADDLREIQDICPACMCENAVRAWTKRWRHCGGGCGATDPLGLFSETGSHHDLRFEKVGYEGRLVDILQRLRGSSFSDWFRYPGEVISISFLLRSNLFLYQQAQLVTWRGLRVSHSHPWAGILAGWHIVGLFVVPLLQRAHSYARRPLWWKRIERCFVLTVRSTPILVDYSSFTINDGPRADTVLHVAALQFVIMALVRFFCSWTRRWWCLMLWPADGSSWFWGGRTSCRWCPSPGGWIVPASFGLCCAFDLALSYLASRGSTDTN